MKKQSIFGSLSQYYFVTFVLTSSFLFVNLFTGVIVESIDNNNKEKVEYEEELVDKEIKRIVKKISQEKELNYDGTFKIINRGDGTNKHKDNKVCRIINWIIIILFLF